MKRQLIFCILFTAVSFCFSQANGFEGYDNLSWGTTVEQFLTKNPRAFEITDEEDGLRNERWFVKEVTSATRAYRFFDDKLWWGRTVYTSPNEATWLAIMEKITEEYGMPTTNGEKMNYGDRGGVRYSWNKSPTFIITYELILRADSYGRVSGSFVYITYENDEISEAIDDYAREKIKQNLEL